MGHRVLIPLPIPQINLPDWLKDYLLKFDPMISEGTALISEARETVSEVRETNRIVQRLLLRQIDAQPPRRRRGAA
jgi:hypothetical protein